MLAVWFSFVSRKVRSVFRCYLAQLCMASRFAQNCSSLIYNNDFAQFFHVGCDRSEKFPSLDYNWIEAAADCDDQEHRFAFVDELYLLTLASFCGVRVKIKCLESKGGFREASAGKSCMGRAFFKLLGWLGTILPCVVGGDKVIVTALLDEIVLVEFVCLFGDIQTIQRAAVFTTVLACAFDDCFRIDKRRARLHSRGCANFLHASFENLLESLTEVLEAGFD